MSNEDFNVLTPEALTSQLMSSINNMIPTVNESFHQMEQMNVMILEAMSKYFSQGVEFLDKWIIGRGENFISNLTGAAGTGADNTDTQYLEDFGIGAAATDSGQTGGTQKFATFYEAEADKIPFKLLADIVEKILSNKMPGLSIEKRTGYINSYKKRIPPKSTTTPKEAIDKSGATGIVKQIATMYANLVKEFKVLAAISNTAANRAELIREQRRVELLVRAYNRFVQSNGKANLTIDTAKSITFRRIIAKT